MIRIIIFYGFIKTYEFMPLPTIPIMNCGHALLREGMKGREKASLITNISSQSCNKRVMP